MAKSRTSAQVVVDEVTGELDFSPWTTTFTFEKSRRMRLDPTLQMARLYSVAPILAASWTVEGDEEEHVKLIKDQLMPLRTHLLSTYLFSEIDFGWKCYEKIFAIDEQGNTVIQEVKPLKCDDTRVRYDKTTGAFKGLRTTDLYTGVDVFIDAQHSLFVNFDEEGLGNYAVAGFQIAEKAYDDWNTCNRAAVKYDDKVAGVYLVVWHPEGKTKLNGVETDNGDIAQTIIRTLRASGSVTIPVRVKNQIDQLNGFSSSKVWEVAFLTPGQMQGAFNERMNYLDKLKARALGVTERSLFEGTYGTKAEAVTHASAVMLCKMLKHVQVTDYFNTRLVDQLLWQNYHVKGTAKLVAQPLTDDRIELFTRVFESLLSDPAAGLELKDAIDKKQLLGALKIPLEEGADFDRAARDLPPADEDQPTKTVTETTKTQFSFNAAQGTHEYATTQINLPSDLAKRVLVMASKIDDADLAEDGREDEPHITVLYGLRDLQGIEETIAGFGKIPIILGKTSLFENEEYDVVKVDVDSERLHKLYEVLSKLPNENKYDKYIPHVTLAYVKKGAGKKYVGLSDVEGAKFAADQLMLRDRDGEGYGIQLSHLNLTRDGIRGKGDGPGGGDGGSDKGKPDRIKRAVQAKIDKVKFADNEGVGDAELNTWDESGYYVFKTSSGRKFALSVDSEAGNEAEERIQLELDGAERAREQIQDRLDEAEQRGDEARIDDLNARLDRIDEDIMALEDDLDAAKENVDDPNSGVVTFRDQEGSIRITGRGEAFEVFSNVVPALAAYVGKYSPKKLYFTAAEKSRSSLYRRIVQSVLSMNKGYEAFENSSGYATEFTLKKVA